MSADPVPAAAYRTGAGPVEGLAVVVQGGLEGLMSAAVMRAFLRSQAMICLAGVPSAGRGLDVLAMMCLAGVPSAGRGLDVLSRPGQQRHAPIRDQSAPSNTVT